LPSHEEARDLRKQQAQAIRYSAVKASSELTRILDVCQNQVSPDEFARLKQGIAACTDLIDIEILRPLSAQYPDLADPK
jgi:hypothetical protein